VCLAAFLLTASGAASASILTITPTFDTSITSNVNSVAIQGAINQAIGVYQSLFTDNINVSILFRYSTTQPNGNPLAGGILAQSNYTIYSIPFNTYTAALIGDLKTANDTTAVANLPGSALAARIDPSSADGRAVGLSTPGAMNSSGGVGAGGT